MTFDAGRIRHDGQLMHYSIGSNGLAIASNWRLAATGDTGVVWAPESATSVSYGSNSNDVSSANAGGGSSLASRADHVHRGVRTVTAAGSNGLFGDVNLSAGTGMAITTSGQTVTFASTATGGASVSYASNSNDVAAVGAAGASTLVSRADHVHKGVTSVSHASNTFYGPVILTASGSLGITVPTPGTFNLSAVAGSGGGSGGSGLTHSYVGTNSIGGSSENVGNRIFLQKITLASAGVILSVGVYVKQVSVGTVMDLACGLLDDVAGTPTHLIAFSAPSNDNVFLSTSNGAVGDARWVHMPLGFYATAGDYWLAINTDGGGTSYNIYFDGSGSDRTYVPTTDRMSDAGWTAVTTTSNKYSIRASFLG